MSSLLKIFKNTLLQNSSFWREKKSDQALKTEQISEKSNFRKFHEVSPKNKIKNTTGYFRYFVLYVFSDYICKFVICGICHPVSY